MKILILNYEFPPMGGGAASATYNVARELALLGHHVDILTSKLPGLPNEEKMSGFKVYRVFSWRKGIHECGFRGALSYVFCTIPLFFDLVNREKYDVLHYFFGLPTGFLTLLPGKHKQIPYIISLRGSDVPLYDIYNKTLQRVHRPLLPFTRHIWKSAKRVVALSQSLKTTALKTKSDLKIDVIPNGIESDLFKHNNHVIAKKENVFHLITVSRLIERKGIQHILHALAKLKNENISLLIVGTGSYENELKHLCTQLSLNEHVKFFGYCPRDKLPDLLSTHDTFILPSMAESFGMAFIEAMACGLPIIAANTGGVPDYVLPENGLLVTPENEDEIQRAILALKNNPKMRMKMSHANRNKAVLEYTWKNVALKYLNTYQDK